MEFHTLTEGWSNLPSWEGLGYMCGACADMQHVCKERPKERLSSENQHDWKADVILFET